MSIKIFATIGWISALLLSTAADAQCYLCRCLQRASDGQLVVTSDDGRVKSGRECAAGCFGAGVGYCSDGPGICDFSVNYKYDLRTLGENQCDDCGRRWTGWRDIGSAGQNPCPEGCERGHSVGKDYRSVGLIPRPQEKDKFQCWGIAVSIVAPPPATPRPRSESPRRPVGSLQERLEQRLGR
jgi:hypothetical protein